MEHCLAIDKEESFSHGYVFEKVPIVLVLGDRLG